MGAPDAGVRLEFYPAEQTVYVVGGIHDGKSFNARGGPARRQRRKNDGGHVAEPTQPGVFVLGPREHHTTPGWTTSVIPYGAQLSKNDSGEVVFTDVAGKWHVATGPLGEVTRAEMDFRRRSRLSRAKIKAAIQDVRNAFLDQYGNLIQTVWLYNDFGEWAWELRRPDGTSTHEYIHSSRKEEAERRELDEKERMTPGFEGGPVHLEESHACVHLDPRDRDLLWAMGVLREGALIVVHRYDEHGPPAKAPRKHHAPHKRHRAHTSLPSPHEVPVTPLR